MEEEIVQVINIKTDQAINTVKELKQYIGELRDDLVKLDKGSDEYKKTVEGLTDAERKLIDVQKAGKDEIEAAAGSYNALSREMSALKKVWKETTDEATRNEIGKRIGELNGQLKEMDASVGVYSRNVGNYKSALDTLNTTYSTQKEELTALKKALDSLDPSTKEYEQAFSRASEITHNLSQRQAQLKYSSADLGDQLSNINGIATNMVAGFSAANAAMGLFGEESEDVQKAMLKVQQAMAVVQGMRGLDGFIKRTQGLSTAMKVWLKDTKAQTAATKAQTVATNGQTVATEGATVAQKGLNAAMKANPVGLILTALTALVMLFVKFKDQIFNLLGGVDKLNAAFAKVKAAIMGVVNVITKQLLVPVKETINYFKTLGTVIKDVFTGNWSKIGDDIKEGLNNSIDIIKDGYNVIENYNEAHNASLQKSNDKAARKRAQDRAKELEEVIENNDAKYDSDWKYTESGKTVYEEYLQAKIDSYKKDSKEYKKAINEKITYDREFAARQDKAAKDAEKKRKEEEEKRKKAAEDYRKQVETIEKNYQAQIQKNFGSSTREIVNSYKEALKAFNDELKLQLKVEKDPDSINNIKAVIKEINKEMKGLNSLDIFRMEDINSTFKLLSKTFSARIDDAIKNSAEENKKKAHDEIVKFFEKTLKPDVNEEIAKLQMETEKQTLILDYNIDYGDFSKKEETEIEKVAVKYDSLNKALDLQREHYQQIADFVNTNNLTPSKEYDEALKKLEELKIEENKLEDSRTKEVNEIRTRYFNLAIGRIEAETDATVRAIEDGFDKSQSELNAKWYKMFMPVKPEEEQQYLNDIYNAQIEGLNKIKRLWEERSRDENLTNEERIEARRQAAITEIEIEEALLDHEIQINNKRGELIDEWVSQINNAVGTIGDLFGSLASFYQDDIENKRNANKISDKEAEKEFEQRVKPLQIAQATISMLQGMVSAFSSAMQLGPIAGPTVGSALAAAVGAMGALNIAKIKNTKYNGSSSSTASSVPAPQINEMPVQYVSNITNQTDTDNLRNAIVEGMASTKLYVSVTDINNVQNKVKVTEDESSF